MRRLLSQKTVKDVSTLVNGRMKLNTDIRLRARVVKEGWRIIMKDDSISRAAAIDAAVEAADEWDGGYSRSREEIITLKLRMLPSAQPEIKTDGDTISRAAAIDALKNRWEFTSKDSSQWMACM